MSSQDKHRQSQGISFPAKDSQAARGTLGSHPTLCAIAESKSRFGIMQDPALEPTGKENQRDVSPQAKNVSPKMIDGIARWQSRMDAISSRDQSGPIDKSSNILSPTTYSVNMKSIQPTTQNPSELRNDQDTWKFVKSPSKENEPPTSQDKGRSKQARAELDPIPYEKLKTMKAGSGIDTTKKEVYLSDDDFYKVFKCSRTAFSSMKSWRQVAEKKKVGLF